MCVKVKSFSTSIFILLFLSVALFASAQLRETKSWTGLDSPDPAEIEINLLASDIVSSLIEIKTNGFWQEKIREIGGNTEVAVFAGNSTPILTKGAPDLGKITAALAIPDLARMQVSILEAEYTDFGNIHVIPSKGNLTRDIDPATVPYEYGREYQADHFFPGVIAELRTPHIIRDVRGQTVIIYPYRYNPVRKPLRVYTKLIIEIKAMADDGENPLVRRNTEKPAIREFEGIYGRNFLNYNEYQSATRYTPLEEDGNMLIISYGSFMTDMQEFVNWKNMSGIPTEMVNVSSVGTTAAAIKTYVANYYNTNGLTYLLLVGDAAQVPTSSTTAGDSDNDYGYIVGSDHYPDIFVGRFSAETNAHVQTQVQRTLEYEMEPNVAGGSYQRAMGIASAEGPGDDGEYDWQHQRNIRTDYMNFTYTYGAELYDGSQGGQDAAGNPTTTMVSAEINTGIGIISYTGHGSTTSWGTTGFSNTNVNALTNNGILPFILSVACVNGNFDGYTCFAEAWLRATYNGQPSGAVATVMSTINQSWNPPMQGQDEMVDILVESFPSNIKRTFGGITMNGCMGMNDTYGSAGDEMTDTWTIFGDPSLMVRTAAPEELTVTHVNDLPVGSDELTVYCDEEGARVAISNDYALLGTGFISGGSVTVDFGQINSEDTLTVTVTAFNFIPHIDTVIISNSDMSYVSCTAFHGNTGEAGPGEQNTEVLGVKVVMSGSLNPFNLTSLTFNLEGTTDLQDVDGLEVYYTGNSGVFSASGLFGTAAVSAGSITITGSQALTGGFNHFWLAFDLDASAGIGHFIDGECTGLVISDEPGTTRIPSVTDPAGAREINAMQLVSVTTTQPNTTSVFPGESDVDIIRVDVTTDGSPVPLQINSIKVSTSGTSDPDDISLISIFYTNTPVFETNQLFGSAAPAGEVVIGGTKILSAGNNYFWVVYDLSAGATPGNELDAECSEVTFAGTTGTQIPAVTDPAGYRIIELDYCIPTYTYGTGYGDYISLVSLGTLTKASGASSAPYYTYYQDVTTHLSTGGSYQLTVSPGTYSSGNNIAAWIDYDRDGSFETTEKLGEVNVPPTPSTGTINFLVPETAFQGTVRLRVREVWSNTSLDPCLNYGYGETEDYEVHIMPPGCWLGYSNEWNDPDNWSDNVVPDGDSQVIIPEILMGDHYPEVFTGNPVIELLEIEEGAAMNLPAGVTITVTGGQD